MQNETIKLEKAQQTQKQNEDTLKDLQNNINEVKREIEAIDERRQMLKSEIHQYKNLKQDLEGDLQLKEQQEKERLQPEIDKMNKLIDGQKQEIQRIDT